MDMSPEQQGREAAADFRRLQHLGDQPLGDLVALIEQTTEIDVTVMDAAPDEHGLTMCDPDRRAVFIAVARTPHPMRQRSSLAHELAHVIFEDWSDETGRDLSVRSFEEQRADAFARHLLAPMDGVRAILGDSDEAFEADLSTIVQRYLVSPAVAAIVLHHCGYVDRATKDRWMHISTPRLATRFGWADQYQLWQNDSGRTRPPQRLLAKAIAGYATGIVSAQTVATVRGLSLESTARELEDAGIVPRATTAPLLQATDLPEVNVDFSDLESDAGDDDVGELGAGSPG